MPNGDPRPDFEGHPAGTQDEELPSRRPRGRTFWWLLAAVALFGGGAVVLATRTGTNPKPAATRSRTTVSSAHPVLIPSVAQTSPSAVPIAVGVIARAGIVPARTVSADADVPASILAACRRRGHANSCHSSLSLSAGVVRALETVVPNLEIKFYATLIQPERRRVGMLLWRQVIALDDDRVLFLVVRRGSAGAPSYRVGPGSVAMARSSVDGAIVQVTVQGRSLPARSVLSRLASDPRLPALS